MGYTVIRDFSDSADGRRIYRVGDKYPHPLAPVPSEDRVKDLLGTGNRQRVPLIRKDVSLATEDSSDTKTGVGSTDDAEAKEKPRKRQGRHARTGA